MKNRENKNLEKLVENMMVETSIESPSIDFTTKVMSGVFAVEKNKAFIYKPVISKKMWFIILVIMALLFGFLFFETPTTNNFNLPFLNSENLSKLFPAFQFSTLTAIVIFSASVMIFIQAMLLNSYLNKRFK